MHYTGNAAAVFVYDPKQAQGQGLTLSNQNAIIGAVAAMVLLLCSVLLLALAELRKWYADLLEFTRELDSRANFYRGSNSSEAYPFGAEFFRDYLVLKQAVKKETKLRYFLITNSNYNGSNAESKVLPMSKE